MWRKKIGSLQRPFQRFSLSDRMNLELEELQANARLCLECRRKEKERVKKHREKKKREMLKAKMKFEEEMKRNCEEEMKKQQRKASFRG